MSITELIAQARKAAEAEGLRYWQEVMGRQDYDACGFVWVEIPAATVRGKRRQELLSAGFRRSTSFGGRSVLIYNFHHSAPTQGMCCLEAANKAAAAVLTAAGFETYVRSRMD